MKIFVRIWLALRISFLEARIEFRRYEMAKLQAKQDDDRRRVNLAHQAFAATNPRRYKPSAYQLRRR